METLLVYEIYKLIENWVKNLTNDNIFHFP